ncbi:hypothetical protein T10_12565 [Trichinella papuae]|uniref:Uncharacterized protein n=1 Tax=Trichinella papuae TaxID=268474 RepID=A0A0V1MP94_9BILA|nr:hypothetical protein T10_12565 [Trichinella papuae]
MHTCMCVWDSGSQTVNRDPLVGRGFRGKELFNTLDSFVKDKAPNCTEYMRWRLYSRCLGIVSYAQNDRSESAFREKLLFKKWVAVDKTLTTTTDIG